MKLSVSLLTRSRVFWLTLIAFMLANVWSWIRHRLDPVCCDQEMTVGFPFPFHISGGITGGSDFYILGLLLNVVLALTVAVLLTRITRFGRSER